MRTSLVPPPCLLAAAAAAPAQELLYSAEASEVVHPSVVVGLNDVDGDGVSDLAIGRRTIQGVARVQVHSGAGGALLYTVGAPGGTAFYGHMIAPLEDLDGDGANDFAVVGSQSGDSHSPPGLLDVISGADGTVLSHFDPPAGVIFREFPGAVAIEDLDGDGRSDVLIATHHSLPGRPEVQAFSSADGAPLFTANDDPNVSASSLCSLEEDFDGDGLVDFAVAVAAQGFTSTALEIRSGADGGLLLVHPSSGILMGFDSAPIVPVPDLDGDGKRDVAVSAPLEALVRVMSSATGATLLDLQGSGPPLSFGPPMLGTSDVDFDGAPDLLISFTGTDQISRVGAYSLVDGHEVFSTPGPIPGLGFGASTCRLPGADPEGFFAFAALHGTGQAYAETFVLRFAPRVGTPFCTSTPNSTGLPAWIEALGTTSLAADQLLLAGNQLPPQQFGLFFYGPGTQQVPFGNGFLCVHPGSTGLGRLPVEAANAAGRIVHRVDYTQPPSQATRILPGSTWHFQNWFRDPQAGGAKFDTSDALTLTFLP